jgi:methanogenic corrinoid protein MtbC1
MDVVKNKRKGVSQGIEPVLPSLHSLRATAKQIAIVFQRERPFFLSEIYSEAEIISGYGLSRSLSSQEITAENSAFYSYRNFAISFPILIFPA